MEKERQKKTDNQTDGQQIDKQSDRRVVNKQIDCRQTGREAYRIII